MLVAFRLSVRMVNERWTNAPLSDSARLVIAHPPRHAVGCEVFVIGKRLGVARMLRAWGCARPKRARKGQLSKSSLSVTSHRLLTIKQRAAYMRHHPTTSELVLWEYLEASQLGVGFRRQVAIGSYIVDFLAPSVRLVVEVDGGYHEERVRLDAARERRLVRSGYTVVRVSGEIVVREPLQAVGVVVSVLGRLR
jgi:very-short-patch-repair endonuclease